VHAIVTRGEMWLTMNGDTQHLQSGSIFELEPNVPHDEQYVAEGGGLLGGAQKRLSIY
jgi:quercetin dioxygenase-like cupin family protein